MVPLHNEAATVEELVTRIAGTLTARGNSYEIVLVDDGSTDDTPRLLAALGAGSIVRVLTLSRNFGQSAALSCGVFESRGQVSVIRHTERNRPEPDLVRDVIARVSSGK